MPPDNLPCVDEDLVGTAEIARLLRLTRQRVQQLTRRDESFPAPVAKLSAGWIWRKADVEQWARDHRPPDEDEDEEVEP